MSAWFCAACRGENPAGTRFCGHCGLPAPSSVLNLAQRFDKSTVAVEEKRWVTTVFADIVGYTSLAETLDVDDLRDLIEPVIATMSRAIERYDGYIAKYSGDALLAFFGAPVAHEDDADRALLAALDMHTDVAALAPRLNLDGRTLALHIGVNSGRVVAGFIGSDIRLDYSLMGDSVNLAQRLEAAAPAHSTFVGSATYELTRERFEYEALGELSLKGKASPVASWRLLGRRRQPSRAGVEAPLVGRDGELAALDQALQELVAGTGSITCIVGNPGVGKSKLAQAARRRGSALGVAWLRARCLSYGQNLPYGPYADLLRRMLGLTDLAGRDALEQLHASLAGNGLVDAYPFFTRLLGLPETAAVDLEPEAFRRGLHRAMGQALETIAGRGPVVLQLEDIHWADESTVDLTRDLVAAMAGARVAFLLTARPAASALVDSLTSHSRNLKSTVISLEPLAETAIAELAAADLGGNPRDALVGFLKDRTGGNPLFVREVIRAVRAADALVRVGEDWDIAPGGAAMTVPPTVEGVLASRLDALPGEDALVLQSAAVVGRRAELDLVRALAPSTDSALPRLVEGHFLRLSEDASGGVLIFEHALTQEVAYNRLLKRHRQDLHLKVATAAERMFGSGDTAIDLLARHYYLGDGGEKAFDCLRQSAARARRLYANQEAIVSLSRALEVAEAIPALQAARCGVLIQVGELQELAGLYPDALESYRRARELEGSAEAWAGMASVMRKQGRPAESLEFLDEAFAANPSGDLRRLWLERASCFSIQSRYEGAVMAALQGLATSPAADDAVAGALLLRISRAQAATGQSDQALEHALRAQAIYEAQEDLVNLVSVMRVIGGIHGAAGRNDAAAEVLRRGVSLAERVGHAEEVGACLVNLGLIEFWRGNLAEAIGCDRRALVVFEELGLASGLATVCANLAEKLNAAGNHDEALIYAQRAVEVARGVNGLYTMADAHLTLASIHAQLGHTEEAAAAAREAAAEFTRAGVPDRSMSAAARAEELEAALREDQSSGIS